MFTHAAMTDRAALPSPEIIAYLRVSTREQAEMGAGLAAQRATIEYESVRRGWTSVDYKVDAGVSGKSMSRPGLQEALRDVEAAPAAVLVVAKLDRLSRSVTDFSALLDRARINGWGLVAVDLGVDTTTPAGELVANVMAAVAQWERRTISQRTKDGLAVKKAEGVRLGRPASTPPDVIAFIDARLAEGITRAQIARELNDQGVATARGGVKWWPSTIRAIEKRASTRT